MKRIFTISLVCLALILLSCASHGEIAEAQNATEVTPEPTLEVTPELEPIDEFCDYLTNDVFTSDGYTVNRNNNVITIDLAVKGLAGKIETIRSDYLTYSENWLKTVNSLTSLSKQVETEAKKKSLELNIETRLVDDVDNSIVYFQAENGEIIYNVMDDVPESKIVFHEASVYKVGSDLDAGEYYIIPEDEDSDVYVCVTSDANGRDIIDNSFQKGAHYITVEDGQYLTVERAKFALASEFPANPVDTISSDGMYLVGKDIVAGEYKLTVSRDRSGYWCIYSTSLATRKIVDNDLFDNASYISVSDGQYVIFEGCTGSLVK